MPSQSTIAVDDLAEYPFSHRHLLTVDALHRLDVEHVFQRADYWRNADGAAPLRRLDVMLAFFEPSTRTRASFELAAKRLGANVVSAGGGAASSAVKGESFRDTVATLDAMAPDILVIRHRAAGAAAMAAGQVRARVVNAGDGAHEHPTQALLDAYTLRDAFGGVEGLRVAVCGDVRHSRVARSTIKLLLLLGAEVRVAAPSALTFPGLAEWGVTLCPTALDAASGAHAVMALRVQRERMAGAFTASTREYRQRFGVTRGVLAAARPDAKVMHPGPMNRGVEIDADVADDPAVSLVTAQVAAGVAVRAAVLDLIALAPA